jgi:N6-L-threonylcarbamoyladenine synthase
VQRAAEGGNPKRFRLPRPLADADGYDFSFSGLKTAVRRVVEQEELTDEVTRDIAASFQAAAVDVLVIRTKKAMQGREVRRLGINHIVVAGGVAANKMLSTSLAKAAGDVGFKLVVPPVALCTDNAAMVAWAGIERCGLGLFSEASVPARARWPLDGARSGIPGAKS